MEKKKSDLTIQELIDLGSNMGPPPDHIPLPPDMLERRKRWAEYAADPELLERHKRSLLKKHQRGWKWKATGFSAVIAITVPLAMYARNRGTKTAVEQNRHSDSTSKTKSIPTGNKVRQFPQPGNPVIAVRPTTPELVKPEPPALAEKRGPRIGAAKSGNLPTLTREVSTKKSLPKSFIKSSAQTFMPSWYGINSVGMEFALIPQGEFRMGADPDDPNSVGTDSIEKPQHPVRISRPFYLGIYEVKREEFEIVSKFKLDPHKSSPRLPMALISWFDAIGFCNSMSAMENLTPYYNVVDIGDDRNVFIPDSNGIGYRLPTESEWEYACRATGPTLMPQSHYSYGNNQSELGLYGWFSGNSGNETHEVGLKSPNNFHLYDMHGNVWEWCWDWKDLNYYAASPANDPMGPQPLKISQNFEKIRRGGSYDSGPIYSRSAFRAWFHPKGSHKNIGFRVAKNVSTNE